jgi:carbamoylphosphate synthase large subunit
MKKLLILGGSRYLIPVIKKAHEIGIYIITADYLPNNTAHKYSDEYVNVDITDLVATLDIAKEKRIDGIISFACDPGVVTASFIAEKLELPFQGGYEAVCILQNKKKFRTFLKQNGFNVPGFVSYQEKEKAILDADSFKYPIIVKPVDSAGSKGVSVVKTKECLDKAIDYALDNSRSKEIIIEEYIDVKGNRSDADIFTIEGKVEFMTFSDQIFDEREPITLTPWKIIWPSTMELKHQVYLIDEIQRLMKLLHMRTGIYNVETCVSEDGIPFIMEVSPRGGGNNIAYIEDNAIGTNLIENEIRKALDLPLVPFYPSRYDGCWCQYAIHLQSPQKCIFDRIDISRDIKEKIKYYFVSKKKGDEIYPFIGADKSLGDLIMRFDSRDELENILNESNQGIKIMCH